MIQLFGHISKFCGNASGGLSGHIKKYSTVETQRMLDIHRNKFVNIVSSFNF